MNLDLPEPCPELPDTVSLATFVEQRLHATLDSFELATARLYGVTVVDSTAFAQDDDASFRLSFLAEHPDVYELLETSSSSLGRMFDAAAVVTTGWAAPLGENGEVEGAPSQHAKRRRVRLTVVVSNQGVASVIRFADQPDDIITDPGLATGSLADAINGYWAQGPAFIESS